MSTAQRLHRGVRAVVFDLDDTLTVDVVDTHATMRATCASVTGADCDALFDIVDRDSGVRWRDAPAIWFEGRGLTRSHGLWSKDPFGGTPPTCVQWLDQFRLDLWGDVLASQDLDVALAESLAEQYRAERVACIRAYDDVLPCLERLAGRVRLGVITNGASDLQRAKLEHAGLREWFDVTIISGEEGVAKPSAGIFTTLVETLGASPDEIVLVGDNPINDVAGACTAGLAGILLRRPDAPLFRDFDASHHVAISTLNELPDLLAIA
jgi:putative hydrolase of the HAD superfamily